MKALRCVDWSISRGLIGAATCGELLELSETVTERSTGVPLLSAAESTFCPSNTFISSVFQHSHVDHIPIIKALTSSDINGTTWTDGSRVPILVYDTSNRKSTEGGRILTYTTFENTGGNH